MIWDCYNNIPNCACEHGISYYSTLSLATGFFRFRSFLLNLVLFVSAVNCSWFLCMSAFQGWNARLKGWGWRMCSSLTVRSRLQWESSTWTRNLDWDSNLRLGLEYSTGTRIFNWDLNFLLGLASSTGTCIFNWDPHICRYDQNMFFYNCQIVCNY